LPFTLAVALTPGALAARAQEDAARPACTAEQVRDAALTMFDPSAPEARRASALLLGRCGGGRATPLLGAALPREPREEVRAAIVDALAQVHEPEAVPFLAQAATHDPSLDVRRRAVQGLVAAGAHAELRALAANPRTPATVRAQVRHALEPAPFAAAASAAPAPAPRATSGSPAEVPLAPAPPPAAPAGPGDGTALAIATSMVAGGVWGGALALLGEQRDIGVVTLLGGAGAVIGGGTAWGLTRFGFRPTVSQSLWYANTTAWGALAGLAAWSASGSDSLKLKYGLLVGGETLGIVGGVWSARHWNWTPAQTLLADSLVIGAGLGAAGVDRLVRPDAPPGLSPAAGYGTAPVMLLAAVGSRYLKPTRQDATFMLAGAGAAAWTTGLLTGGLHDRNTAIDRHGVLAGLGLGYLAATAATPFTEISTRQTLTGATGLVVGNAFGLGLHMLAAPAAENRWGVGAALGGVGVGAVAFAGHRYLEPGTRALSLTTTGALYGSGVWLLGARAAHTEGTIEPRLSGGVLAFGVGGAAAGYLSSRWFAPDAADQLTTAAGTSLGISAGLGTARLLTVERGAPDLVGVTAGAAVGFTGAALFTQANRLRPPEVSAGLLGAAHGTWIGALVPTLHLDSFRADRDVEGGALLGLAAGALGGTTVARLMQANGGQVAVPGVAGALGAAMGSGVGLMIDDETSRGQRIGAIGGASALMLGAAVSDRWLRLSDGLGDGAVGLGLSGAALGAWHGHLAGDLFIEDGSGSPSREKGALLVGASAGLTGGLVASRWLRPTLTEHVAVAAGGMLGLSLGQGLHVAAHGEDHERSPRSGAGLRLGGSLAGMLGTGLAAHHTDLRGNELLAGALGAGYGAWMGALAPSLHERWWDDGHAAKAGSFIGTAVGGFGAAAATRLLGASGSRIALGWFGGTTGLLTGLGIGGLIDEEGSRAQRIGITAGSAAGVAVGGFLWPRLTLSREDRLMVAAATGLGAWNGVWIGSRSERGRSELAGFLAGSGGSAFIATALVPALDLDLDLQLNALTGNALGAGLGAGVGALVSRDEDAAVYGMLAGGAAGLLTGGALHERLELGPADAPLLTLAAFGGAFQGLFLPRLIWQDHDLDDRRARAGLTVGTLGATAAAALASPWIELDAREAAVLGMGGAIGASLAGGTALLSDGVEGRASAALTMGGTTAGLIGGALLNTRNDRGDAQVGSAMIGAGIGAAEGLVFAWAGRADGADDYQGATLIGAGLGATLGLAAGDRTDGSSPRAFASAGFAAWGAWMGAFVGALAQRDPHEVTLGGLVGLNAGLAAGHGLLRSELVQPSDFGWLSLFAAGGTVAAGGVGAIFSTEHNPAPALAGLAAGPAVGMITGAFLLPKVRALSAPGAQSSSPPSFQARRSRQAIVASGTTTPAPAETSADVLLARPQPSRAATFGRRLIDAVGVTSWMPTVSTLPPPYGAPPTSPAMLVGVTGLLR
jgi:hypothetical protein